MSKNVIHRVSMKRVVGFDPFILTIPPSIFLISETLVVLLEHKIMGTINKYLYFENGPS